MGLHELAPVGGRATSGRDGRRLKWFAEVCENLPDGPRLRDERDQPDVATAVRALKWKLLPHPGHEFRPGNPRRVVRAGRLIRVAVAPCGATVVPMPTGRGPPLLADVADRECRDGGPQFVIRRKHPVVVTCPRAAASGFWLPPTGPIKDSHLRSFIQAQRTSRYARLGQAPTGDLQKRRYTKRSGGTTRNCQSRFRSVPRRRIGSSC